MSRIAKQLLYGSIFIIVILVVLGFFYLLLKPAPTCFDGIKNQNEQGVDCGGPPIGGCAKACIPSGLRPLSLEDIRAISVDSAHVSLLAYINNPNIDYAAKRFSYVFEISYENGAPSSTFTDYSFIYGGERKYLVLPNKEVATGIKDVKIVLQNAEWIPSIFFLKPQVRLIGMNPDVTTSSIKVEGTLTNDDTIIFPSVEAVGIFRGNLGEVLGMSRTEVRDVVPGESRSFTIVHPAFLNFDVTKTEILLYTLRP